MFYLSNVTEIKALVDGGKASAGPPLGPALGPLRVNVRDVISEINDKTSAFVGMKVPVVVKVNIDTREFEIEVKTPQTSVLLIKEAGAEKGSGTSGTETIGDVSIDQVIKVTQMKSDLMLSIDFKNSVKEVVGTCLSCGITVGGKNPKEVITEIDNGQYDKLLN